jgi:hypothetical protein|tara:strand:+ start:325 stop:456 length:132 start_codon:yes stop_codon:yes gene_type:complete
MIKFVAGALFMLALVYPAVTKDIFGDAVDAANNGVKTAINLIS